MHSGAERMVGNREPPGDNAQSQYRALRVGSMTNVVGIRSRDPLVIELLVSLPSCPDRQFLDLFFGEVAVAMGNALFELAKLLQRPLPGSSVDRCAIQNPCERGRGQHPHSLELPKCEDVLVSRNDNVDSLEDRWNEQVVVARVAHHSRQRI